MTLSRRLLRIGGIGAVVLLVLGAVSWVGDRVLGDDFAEGYHLTARFEAAVGLYPFGDVSSMGVAIGTVDAVEIDDDHVRVEMTIRSDVPLPADVRATIEPLTLIGERNVVLFPPWDAEMAAAGKARAGEGDVIPIERTVAPVEPDEALETFNELARSLDPDTVSDLVRSGDEAIAGLGDELGLALDQASGITSTLAEVDTQLVAAADSLHVLAGTLLEREEQLGALVRNFSDATEVLAAEREGIRSFIASLVELTEQGRGILETYGEQLPQDIAHFTALAMLLDANRGAAEQLVEAFPEVAEGIARGYQPDIGGIYLRANGTPTLVGLLEVFRDLLGVLAPEPTP
ncbi:MAG TPA: MCE family protein [Acidimicrobiales bacterium]|nr:MCE family protein [Acidimicrobiales bacterium]